MLGEGRKRLPQLRAHIGYRTDEVIECRGEVTEMFGRFSSPPGVPLLEVPQFRDCLFERRLAARPRSRRRAE
jgi:hypothetical protein